MPFNKCLFDTLFIESVKAKLDDPRDRCAGNVLLYYAGKWTPVCQKDLSTNLKNAICEELVCGKSESDSTFNEGSEIQGLLGIKCQNNLNSVSKCDLSTVSQGKCTVGYLKCKGIYPFFFLHFCAHVQTFRL